ncbi:glycoside hydrolase family 10 protein [Myxosarcina sp. GI1]|uniref:glycoside hydrolase family 10 protein n=1 Tax=Myxosarcina sp. GI1 TaxID=1541065 RepID=UPI0005648EAD|nr:glycoside hydrolase family 10 protein [Myxosarcina sp. GI1]
MKERIAKTYDNFANKLVQFSRDWGRPSWLVFLFILTFIIIALTPLTGNTQLPSDRASTESVQTCTSNTDRELRGVWLTNIDSDVLFSRQKTSEAISNLAELNFNTLYPTVWNWGHTLYPSQVSQQVTGYPQDPIEELKNRDLLDEIITAGHKKNLAVIPWFEFGFMAPADSVLAQSHPQWWTMRRDGDAIWWEGDVHQRVWLNPLHPEVQKFITDLVVEVVSSYDVDGIQFDDHFGYPSELGYDEYTVELYKQEHGGKSPPEDSQAPEWIRWRANKITAYMETLFHEIKQANPQAIVSLSPNPQEFSLNSFLLDWYRWERMGLIEELIVQVYRDRQKSFIKEIQQPEIIAASQHIPVGIGILSGLKGRKVYWNNINKQINAVRDRHLSGVSFFFYESLWNLAAESPERRQAALKSAFKEPVERPQLDDCQFAVN